MARAPQARPAARCSTGRDDVRLALAAREGGPHAIGGALRLAIRVLAAGTEAGAPATPEGRLTTGSHRSALAA